MAKHVLLIALVALGAAGSPYRKPINEALVRLRQDETYGEIYTKWFGGTVK